MASVLSNSTAGSYPHPTSDVARQTWDRLAQVCGQYLGKRPVSSASTRESLSVDEESEGDRDERSEPGPHRLCPVRVGSASPPIVEGGAATWRFGASMAASRSALIARRRLIVRAESVGSTCGNSVLRVRQRLSGYGLVGRTEGSGRSGDLRRHRGDRCGYASGSVGPRQVATPSRRQHKCSAARGQPA